MFWNKDKNEKRLSKAQELMECDEYGKAVETLSEVIDSQDASAEIKGRALLMRAHCRKWLATHCGDEIDPDFDPNELSPEEAAPELSEEETEGIRLAVEDLNAVMKIDNLPEEMAVEALNERLKEYAQLGEYDKALKDIEKILSVENGCSEQTEAEMKFKQAEFYCCLEDFDKACGKLGELINSDKTPLPIIVKAIIHRAELNEDLNRTDSAKADYQRLVDMADEVTGLADISRNAARRIEELEENEQKPG
ncbi:tetratricopeptide repeat protein [Sedimentisphaera salicampi]|uniref:Tetratricopeptide repeat containing protein n=1 Tax=Sedimentisphaera salicampi TaxID=1941349 RepID=A0A1W6LPY4_9BACT|nr:hypothetical protein [Sedimentisphaera salicampi]ARN57811.1 Tetratricopeptide repeat containing protein [Sedimentisphaera salicampi]OXU13979.1 hypothetical protein SMSP1_02140 [Sedimentisphaera salicampi]